MNFIKDILIPCVCVTAAAFSYGVVFHIKGKKLLTLTAPNYNLKRWRCKFEVSDLDCIFGAWLHPGAMWF